MNKINRAFVLLGLATVALLASANAQAQSVTVKQGADVTLKFTSRLYSSSAKLGDKVTLKVAENFVLGGRTILAAGTPVTGVVSNVDKRDRFGKNARIRITLNPVKSAYGEMIQLEPRQKGNQLSGSRTDKAAVASGAGALVLGPVGLVGGYFVHGKNVKIRPGDRLYTEVAQDVVVMM